MKQYYTFSIVGKTLTMVGDFVVLNLLLTAFMLWGGSIVPPFFEERPAYVFFNANVAMLLSQLIFPTVVYKRRILFSQVMRRVFSLVILQAVIMFVSLKLLSKSGGFFTFILIFTPSEYVSILLFRYCELHILRYYRKTGGNSREVVLIGNDEANLVLYNSVLLDPSNGYRVLGYYSDKPFVECPKELKYLGNIEQLNSEMADLDNSDFDKNSGLKVPKHNSPIVRATEIFVCMSHNDSAEIVRIMRFCFRYVKRFFYVPRFFYGFHINLKLERFGDVVLFTSLEEPLNKPFNKIIKRSFDIVFSSIVCLCLLPFIPIIGLIIKIQSPGPIFFCQERTGLNGKPFKLIKFRSMHVNANADNLQATKDDPRKFPFGNFMRKTNIDEFPQFFNVLKGDMSVVGPRPHMLVQTEMYSQLIDKYMVRHFSKPGITGWAQVTGARGEAKELWQMEKRVRRDIWYIEHWTWWLDLRIIFMTFISIFRPNKNAY